MDDLKNPLDGFKVYINYDIFDTFVSVRFIDSSTNQIITSTDIQATILGTHKDGVVDQLGNHKESYDSSHGLLSLALNPKDPYIPSAENPIKFSINASTDGYQEQTLNITVDEIGFHYFDIYLEKESVLTQGVKKYTRQIPLKNSAVIENFNLLSSQGECNISILEDVLFLDANHNPVSDTLATIELIVYTNIYKAPIPNNLVTDIEIDASIEKKAFNPINIISLSLKTASTEIYYTDNGEIEVKLGIDTDFINPITGDKLNAGEILPVFHYSKHWTLESNKIIENTNDSLYISFETTHLSLFSIGILQHTCSYTGDLLFSLSNDFPSQPIGTRVYCYRTKDNKYINYTDYNITTENLDHPFAFFVPIDDPVDLRIRQRSNSNGFTATPMNISAEYPCDQNYSYNIDLKSTSINFKGQVKFHFVESFPQDNFTVRVNFHNADNDTYLFSKAYNISQDATIQIDSGIPSNTNIYLKFSAVNADNAFISNPEKLYIDDPSISNQSWIVDITPTNCVFSGQLNINYTEPFNNENLELKLLFIDTDTGTLSNQKILSFNPLTNNVPFSTVLPKDKHHYVRIIRTMVGQKFQAYPYELDIDSNCQQLAVWDIDLSPATEQPITFNVTVDCPSVEIFPTLQGFYRTVWEDNWQNAEIIDGFLEKMLEMNGTYEIGLIIDGDMKIEEYKVTDIINYIVYELNDEECDKMGW